MLFPSTCFSGRIVIREDGLAGLDWTTPCRIPPETRIPTEPAMFFCVQHGQAIYDVLFGMFDPQGLIDHDIVMGPGDEFDELIDRLRSLEGQ